MAGSDVASTVASKFVMNSAVATIRGIVRGRILEAFMTLILACGRAQFQLALRTQPPLIFIRRRIVFQLFLISSSKVAACVASSCEIDGTIRIITALFIPQLSSRLIVSLYRLTGFQQFALCGRIAALADALRRGRRE